MQIKVPDRVVNRLSNNLAEIVAARLNDHAQDRNSSWRISADEIVNGPGIVQMALQRLIVDMLRVAIDESELPFEYDFVEWFDVEMEIDDLVEAE